jgi:hypothetical protein
MLDWAGNLYVLHVCLCPADMQGTQTQTCMKCKPLGVPVFVVGVRRQRKMHASQCACRSHPAFLIAPYRRWTFLRLSVLSFALARAILASA